MNLSELAERLRLPVETRVPSLAGATDWLNSPPLIPPALDGKVVLVDFWTYTCINWIRTLPYLRAWVETYGPHGLVVVGVHTPEFGIEHDVDNVRREAQRMAVDYPIAIDNRYAVWNAFANLYWPALYVADAEGRIRHHNFGEGGYRRTDRVIRRLLTEAGSRDVPRGPAPVTVRGIEAAADWPHLRSPETFLGLHRSGRFASPGGQSGAAATYALPPQLRSTEWALGGKWTIEREGVVLNEPTGRIACRFHARDLNMILAPPTRDTPIRFRVSVDGEPPGESHGLDVDDDGYGVARDSRLYQMIRQPTSIEDRTFEIELFDRGVAALSFTFG